MPRVILALVAFCVSAAAQTYSYRTFAYPNADATYPLGINSQGTVVGWVFDVDENTYGFIYKDGNFKQVSLGPAGSQTYLTAINDRDEIIGYNYDIAGSTVRSYLIRPDGTIRLVLPNSTAGYSAILLAINDIGHSLGTYDNNADNTSGFLDVNGTLSPIYRSNQPTAVKGLNNHDQVVGYTFEEDVLQDGHGMLYSNGNYTTIDYPGQPTELNGINDGGVIVGIYTPLDQYSRGFLYFQGTFSSIDVPGSVGTSPTCINNKSVIAGFYNGAGNSSGAFIATPN